MKFQRKIDTSFDVSPFCGIFADTYLYPPSGQISYNLPRYHDSASESGTADQDRALRALTTMGKQDN